MSLDAEAIVERRQLRRSIGKWRLIAIAIAVVAIVALSARFASNGALGDEDQIARVSISGLITEDHRQLQMLQELADADHVKAVLLRVNSPGGTTTGGEALYQSIRNISEKKPVVAVFGTVAASAAYIVGIASDRIVARGNSITGSIGVIFQWAEVHGVLDKLGVRMNEMKSGTLKASPSMFKPLDDESRALVEDMVAESHRWFIDLVKERRKVTETEVPGLINGRIYSGRVAQRLKLVDELGGEAEAITWLEEQRNIKTDLPVNAWKPKRDSTGLGIFAQIAGRLGLTNNDLAQALKNEPLLQRLRLDGLLSVWQVPSQ